MYYKPTKFNQNRWSHFWENQIFLFFLMWTTLNFRGRGKTKKTAGDIYKWTLDIEFELDLWIGLGSMFGDSHTDRQILTDIFLEHFFRMREWYRTKNHKKKSKSNFLPIAILPSLLMSLESKKLAYRLPLRRFSIMSHFVQKWPIFCTIFLSKY